MEIDAQTIIARLRSLSNPENVAGMARFGINPQNTLGISIPVLRQIAKETGKDHSLALELWDSGIHEARILAAFVDDPRQVDEAQMERWALDFDSWDVCDQVTGSLFDRTPYAYAKAAEWSARPEQFVKRAAFAMLAWLAVHDKRAGDERFEPYLDIILREAADERNFVKKAVNWALRSIGKRSRTLNEKAINTARQMAELDSRAARWNAANTLRELTSPKIQAKLG
jgi:3-methyladenine DNA glycosylase AlkD